jgi:4-diphosphocytidyl-2-C-methyl-D-erythritol kinase
MNAVIEQDGRVWWPAPAKLNLCLHVTGRRADGYHQLQTVFQLIDLCDRLSFEIDPTGAITRVDDAAASPGPLAAIPSEEDLVVRAARALQTASGATLGARIRLRKRIPMGGGLGGGSSDAATTLHALDRLWATGLGTAALAEIGLALGADVPVFVHGRSAVGEGVGERLTPVALPPRWFLVLHPGVSIPTRDIFQAPDLRRDSPVLGLPALLAGPHRNDCEPVVRSRSPAVAEALDWLCGRAPARLTGTGACLFAAFETAAAAERIAGQVPDRWRVWVARGLDASPVP